MFEKLKMLSARLDELEMRLSAPDLYDDPARAARLLRERNELEPIVEAYRAYERTQQQLADATEMLSDPDMKELAQEELQQAKSDIARLEDELKILLLPKDPNDEKNIYVEIRGGAGGEESALFAADLYRMYTMYADRGDEPFRDRAWRLQGNCVPRRGRPRVFAAQVRERRTPCAARPGNRKSGPRAYLDHNGGRAARGGGA